MKHRAMVALLICVPTSANTLLVGSSQKQIEYNKALGRRVFTEIYGQGKISLVDELYADDFVDDSPGGGKGRDLIKKAVTDFHRAMPDLRIEIEDVFATEDKVVLRYTARGTQTGSYGDIPATGKKAVVRGITIFQFANGKIKTEWTEYDRLGLMRQLGVVP
jgi:steroid delta-isomerase-like uncharacterized protein